ncbi:MAG: flagellar biosynthesis anti-sigma factor FlgM [Lachnospiraceae bacterium]|nr:flagellar biosynthesis anti-sigma factor FlgM [Lachnospiraceae bacterium]MBR5765767.1 flagellar biosynthesis anti-sigma factor FlgM [Lachnospiraceae bacterium]MBR6468947.1 flagellar biosynthesis anti-sigma factor FlgM [Lachnospiraceae bacterium]MBR6486330.1 flagellar biosynthesis anti-sigma factor FlgM [Lachnospiraceae bacterium]
MRIEAYNQIGQIYAPKKTYGTQKTNSVSRTDQVQISSLGKDIQTLKQAVANAPDVRSELTEPLKARVNSGNYDVSTDDFASKLMAAYGM